VGDLFSRHLLIGIFGATRDIADEVKNDELNPFHVYVHAVQPASGISPETAQLKIENYGEQVFFWSLVIDETAKRAAVTYHGLLAHAPIYGPPPKLKRAKLSAIRQDPTIDRLESFLQALENEKLFQDGYPDISTLRQGLREWIE
jgi:hypothetical protein